MLPQEGHKWFTSWLPLAVQAGPFLTVGLGVIMCVSLYWMNGWLSDCIAHNRQMAAQLVNQQKEFHSEILTRFIHCPPVR